MHALVEKHVISNSNNVTVISVIDKSPVTFVLATVYRPEIRVVTACEEIFPPVNRRVTTPVIPVSPWWGVV